MESYDPITNSWQPEVSMGTRRSCLGVAVLHGLLYAAGGYDGASCLNRYTQTGILQHCCTSLCKVKVINVCSEFVTPQEMAPTLQCLVIYLLNAEQMWV